MGGLYKITECKKCGEKVRKVKNNIGMRIVVDLKPIEVYAVEINKKLFQISVRNKPYHGYEKRVLFTRHECKTKKQKGSACKEKAI